MSEPTTDRERIAAALELLDRAHELLMAVDVGSHIDKGDRVMRSVHATRTATNHLTVCATDLERDAARTSIFPVPYYANPSANTPEGADE